jgi:hypothetical protein
MPDYKHGKIYTVRCKTDDTLIYVGSTTQPLSERMAKHKYDSIRIPTICFYQYINNWNDWYIELFENYPCENKEQLNKREGEIIREIGTVNKIIAGRTKKEWYEDNKDKKKEYYEDNKDILKEKAKEYRETNKDKLKEHGKKYREVNKERKKEYNKKYYESKKNNLKK